jgi:ABC-type uncharacterized transport system ATPase subunit
MVKEPLVRLENISKIYPDGVKALDNVSLEVYPGEILGLLGENGAGKTTLMRILYGEIKPSSGKIYIRNREVVFHGPWDALKHGIRMIYQHFSLIDEFTVIENMHLFMSTINRKVTIDETRRKAEELLKTLGFQIPLDEPVGRLPIGVQQKVEIVKSLITGAEILILDEPTSVLNPIEIEELFRLIRTLREKHVSIIFISHKLREIKELTNRVVVLRKGRIVGEAETANIDESTLAKMMIGEELHMLKQAGKTSLNNRSKEILVLENIQVKGDKEQSTLKGISLKIYCGEVVGVVGIQGNGQKELAEAIIGLRKPIKGRIFFEDEDITNLSVEERLKKGISFIPESRKIGLVGEMDVSANVLLTNHVFLTNRFGIIMTRELDNLSVKVMKDYEVLAASPRVLVKHLSGGNQQKIMTGRELVKNPKLLIAMEPTQGLDVKSTQQIRQLLLDHRNKGGAVLLISSDLEELLLLSNRLVVMFNGRITAEGTPNEFTVEKIGLCMGGSC